MGRFLWICVGGALGTGARYLLGGWLVVLLGSAFPFGTLAVNVLGSFLTGLVMQIALTTSVVDPTVRVVLTTGFLGGFTTYSAFNYETIHYAREGALLLAAFNVGLMTAACLIAGFFGVILAQWWLGASLTLP
jgi:fluoride exporter